MSRILAVVGAIALVALSAAPSLPAASRSRLPKSHRRLSSIRRGVVRLRSAVRGHPQHQPLAHIPGGRRRDAAGHVRWPDRVASHQSGHGCVEGLQRLGAGHLHLRRHARCQGQGSWLLYFFEGDADGPGVWYTRGQIRSRSTSRRGSSSRQPGQPTRSTCASSSEAMPPDRRLTDRCKRSTSRSAAVAARGAGQRHVPGRPMTTRTVLRIGSRATLYRVAALATLLLPLCSPRAAATAAEAARVTERRPGPGRARRPSQAPRQPPAGLARRG